MAETQTDAGTKSGVIRLSQWIGQPPERVWRAMRDPNRGPGSPHPGSSRA